MKETTEPLDDMAVWHHVRPLIRSMLPTKLEVSIYNGGDIVETRAYGKGIPGLTRGFQLKPGKRGFSCPSMYEEVNVCVYTDEKKKTETQVQFRTRGGDNFEDAWRQHEPVVSDLLPKGIYLAEKHVVAQMQEKTRRDIERTKELLARAVEVIRG